MGLPFYHSQLTVHNNSVRILLKVRSCHHSLKTLQCLSISPRVKAKLVFCPVRTYLIWGPFFSDWTYSHNPCVHSVLHVGPLSGLQTCHMCSCLRAFCLWFPPTGIFFILISPWLAPSLTSSLYSNSLFQWGTLEPTYLKSLSLIYHYVFLFLALSFFLGT